MYNFLIVDDHAVIRAGVISVLKKEYFNSEFDEAADEESCIQSLSEKNYKFIVLDVNMPNTDCFRLITNIKRTDPKVLILIFTAFPEKVYAMRFFQFGVNGFLHKDAESTEILKAVSTIFNKRRYMSQNVAELLNDVAIFGSSSDPFRSLSAREMMVMMYMLKGIGVSEIALLLNAHISTIATYKKRIFKKCNVDNVIELNRMAEIYMP